jgi:hypothetical protein
MPGSGGAVRVRSVPFSPHDAGTNAVGRARRLLDASLPSSPAGLPVSVRTDIRRLSTVMAVAALDTYMHRLIVDRVYTHPKLPGALAKLEVTFEGLLEQADAAKVAARAKPHHSRPRVAVKRQLRDRLLRETFQRFDDVAKALGMSGLSRNWEAIGSRMNPPMTRQQIRTRLNNLVTRRNQVVHEGDYRRLERPRNPGRNALTYAKAKSDIEFVAELIDAIHAVVSRRLAT